MGRRATGFFDPRTSRWYARLGPVSEKSGKRLPVMLRHGDGSPILDGKRTPAVDLAIARLQESNAAAERGSSGPTVAEVCREFVAWHAANDSAIRTVQGHHYYLGRFCRFAHQGVPYANRPAESIEPEDLWRLDDAMGGLRLQYSSVLACWAWASRPVKGRDLTRMIPSNPLAKIRKPPRGKITRKRFPWAETRRLLRFARNRARSIGRARKDRTRYFERLRVLALRFIAVTGCRPKEAATLEWGDLNLDARLVTIPSERTKTRKTGKDRRFAIPRRMACALAVIKASPAAHPRWVFVPAWTRADAPTPEALGRWWREELRPAAIAAGLDIPEGATLYWLRHEFQSLGLEVMSAEAVSAVAGNSPKVLLETYHHQAESAAVMASDLIAERRRRKG